MTSTCYLSCVIEVASYDLMPNESDAYTLNKVIWVEYRNYYWKAVIIIIWDSRKKVSLIQNDFLSQTKILNKVSSKSKILNILITIWQSKITGWQYCKIILNKERSIILLPCICYIAFAIIGIDINDWTNHCHWF